MAPPGLGTDEWVDRLYSRPVARALVALAARTPLTPNQLTLIAAAHGVAAGVFLGLGAGAWCAAGLLGFLAWDCADGQLARRRGVPGYLGRAVDGLGDYAAGIALHVGLCVDLARGLPLAGALALGLGAGASLAACSAALDRYKRRYRGDTDDLAAIERERAEARGWRRWLLGRFLPYAARLNRAGAVADRDAYRRAAAPALRLWLWVGPSTHLALLALAAAWGRAEAYAWVAVGPLNLLALCALGWQRRADRAGRE